MTVVPWHWAMDSAILRVPTANFGISNTPTGPFHSTVLEFRMIFFQFSMDFGPASMPCQPSGISCDGTVWTSASLLNSLATRVWTESERLTPRSLARAMISTASGINSSSWSELPILPPSALMKV